MTKLIEKYWLIIVLAAIIIIFVFIINDNDFKKNEIQDQSSFINDLESNAEDHHAIDQSIIVDVKGEVNKPGVYEIDSYSRVINVIELAGGFTNNADELYVNLAQKVQDEMVIIVPKIGESSSNHSESSKIRINYATQEEIETLNGIGPAKAQAMIKHREENGFFQRTDDLLQVPGIGSKVLESIIEDIQIP